jgi:hypothetical protein
MLTPSCPLLDVGLHRMLPQNGALDRGVQLDVHLLNGAVRLSRRTPAAVSKAPSSTPRTLEQAAKDHAE